MKPVFVGPVNRYGALIAVGLLCLCLMISESQPGGFVSPAVVEAVADNDTPSPAVSVPTPLYTYEIIASYPHDPTAFTQGLVYEKGYFYESTGLYGNSSLRKVNAATGTVVKRYDLPSRIFGEGLAVLGDTLIQLTWRSGLGFVYDKERFTLVRRFSYSTEGWGLTFDGKRLIMTDGLAKLYFLDPETFAEIGTIEVRDHHGPVAGLNELEYVRGEVFANVLPTDRIARIDPQTGRLTGWIDLTGLLLMQRPDPAEKPLNGIAYDSENDRLFVTGKLWPKVFEIKVVPVQ